MIDKVNWQGFTLDKSYRFEVERKPSLFLQVHFILKLKLELCKIEKQQSIRKQNKKQK